jgi:23S rRNA (cytidine1920-2'-O)/16S rRNA (cytidine1409-2'-O)-methyltransferase
VNGVKEKNPKAMVPVDAELRIRGAEEADEEIKWVSRGGVKLHGLLQKWSWEVKGKVVLDAGSSTGGFVQALLRAGAEPWSTLWT